jgi:hypothetical protein
LARSHFSYEKRRKELEKQKKKEAKRLAKAERKAAIAAGEAPPEPEVTFDKFGNAIEVESDDGPEAESQDENDTSEEPDPA